MKFNMNFGGGAGGGGGGGGLPSPFSAFPFGAPPTAAAAAPPPSPASVRNRAVLWSWVHTVVGYRGPSAHAFLSQFNQLPSWLTRVYVGL